MEWTVSPWVLERAPPLTKWRDGHKILHWHGELIGERNDETGEGITDAGGILIDTAWDSDVDGKFDDSEDDEDGARMDDSIDPYDNNADHYLWENPMAEDFVRGLKIDWNALAANPADWALDLMEQYKIYPGHQYPWNNLCRNTNPRARALWEKAQPRDLDWGWLSSNPNAIDKIWATWRDPMYPGGLIDQCFILWNPAAEKLVTEEYKADITRADICYNSDPWPAMRKIQESFDMKYALFHGFGRNTQSWAIARMREYTEWTPRARGYLYTNPSPEVLEMIRDNPDRFPLAPVIWSNPGIFELTIPVGLVSIITSIELDL